MKKHIMPNWVHIICLIWFFSCMTGAILGKLKFGGAPEETIALIIAAICFVAITTDDIIMFIKKKKEKQKGGE